MGPARTPKHPLDALFRPRSIAVIGASSDPEKIGGRPIRYLARYGFAGPVYPVNPRYDEVQGLRAYPSIDAVEGEVDLALVALPATAVEDAIAACAGKGVRAAVIFSAGYAETGEEGRAAQARIVARAREGGMRLLGPNCMGVAALDHNMIITFGLAMEQVPPDPGPVGIVSQSGAYGGVAYYEARRRRLGVTLWVTTGNECDVNVAECLAYMAEDDAIRVILVYMEGCRDGPGLMAALDAALRRRKPVVVMKVGSSEVGREAAVSHTASLTGSDAAIDAVFRRYNAYRARTMDEFFDIGYACTAGRFPTGRRLGLVTISGGVGVLMSDVAARLGLEVPRLPEAAQRRIREVLPYAGTRNPVDVTGQTLNDPSILERCLDIMIEEGRFDVIVCYLASMTRSPVLGPAALEVFRAIHRRHPEVLIINSGYTLDEVRDGIEKLGYLNLEEPTRAVRAAAALMRLGRGYAETERSDPPPKMSAMASGPRSDVANEVEAKRLLARVGLSVVEERLARSAAEAAESARGFGLPVALKIVSPDLPHKSDIGGVLLDLDSIAAVRRGYAALIERARDAAPDARIDGISVAPMVKDGVETILGVKRDPVFGPVVMFGLGGVFVEVLGNVTRRLAPFGEREALDMIREVKGYPLLAGTRGGRPADVPALAVMLARLSAFAYAAREWIDSIDLNPVIVRGEGEGAVAVDALIVPRR